MLRHPYRCPLSSSRDGESEMRSSDQQIGHETETETGTETVVFFVSANDLSFSSFFWFLLYYLTAMMSATLKASPDHRPYQNSLPLGRSYFAPPSKSWRPRTPDNAHAVQGMHMHIVCHTKYQWCRKSKWNQRRYHDRCNIWLICASAIALHDWICLCVCVCVGSPDSLYSDHLSRCDATWTHSIVFTYDLLLPMQLECAHSVSCGQVIYLTKSRVGHHTTMTMTTTVTTTALLRYKWHAWLYIAIGCWCVFMWIKYAICNSTAIWNYGPGVHVTKDWFRMSVLVEYTGFECMGCLNWCVPNAWTTRFQESQIYGLVAFMGLPCMGCLNLSVCNVWTARIYGSWIYGPSNLCTFEYMDLEFMDIWIYGPHLKS